MKLLRRALQNVAFFTIKVIDIKIFEIEAERVFPTRRVFRYYFTAYTCPLKTQYLSKNSATSPPQMKFNERLLEGAQSPPDQSEVHQSF